MFLDAGYDPLLFWRLSLQEVFDCIDSYRRKLEREEKQQEAQLRSLVSSLYIQSIQNASAIAHSMNGKGELPKLESYYPDLFKTEQNYEQESAPVIDVKMENYKLNFIKYAKDHNNARKERG